MVEKQLKVFISYSIKDSEIFDVPLISRSLESKSYPEIGKVMYCQRDAGENWVDFMNENIPKSDVFLLFCTPNIIKSRYIKDEWQTAYAKDIPIIPVFINPKHIPDVITNRNGFEFDQFSKAEAIHNLCDFILNISGIERTEDKEAKLKEEISTKEEAIIIILEKLKFIAGTGVVAIVSAEGNPVASLLPQGVNETRIAGLPITSTPPKGIDEMRLAAMTAALVSLAERTMIEIGQGEFSYSITAGTHGVLLIYHAGPNAVVTMSLDRLVDLREVLREIQPIAEKIAEII